MPVVVHIKCHRCKSEAERPNLICTQCGIAKHVPSNYFCNKERQGNELAAYEREGYR